MIKQAERFRLFALTGLASAAVLSYARVLSGTSWIFPTLIAAWLSIAASHGLRMTRLWRPTTFVVSLLLGTWFVALVVFPETTIVAIPTPKSIAEILRACMDAWRRSREEFSPVVPDAGFLTLLMMAAWISGALSVLILKASSSRQSLTAAAPWAALFGYAAAVGTQPGRQLYVALFLAGLIVFVFSDSWRSIIRTPHFSGISSAIKEPRIGEQASMATKIGLFSIVGAFVIPMVIPGYGSTGLISWGDAGPSKRIEISPFVQIAPRLNEDTQTTLFTVKADAPAYWRLTSLNRFDGHTWELQGDFERAGRRIELRNPPVSPGAEMTQNYRIFGLAGSWVPAAYAPRSINGLKILVDPVRDTLLTDSLVPETRFTVVSVMPAPTAEQLQAAGVSGGPSEFLELPSNLPPQIQELSRQIAQRAATPYDQALAIQEYLRRFTYSEEVPPGHSADYLVRFLFQLKSGYCEQFAGSMAVMLRTLGIPARVAVGFLPGQQTGDTFTITNREAHAWPEAFFSGVGWVAFEPTPRAEAAPPAYASPAPAEVDEQPQDPVPPAEVPVEDPPPDFANELEPVPEPPASADRPIDFAWRVTVRILMGSAIVLLLLFVSKQAFLLIPLAGASTPAQQASASMREFLARAADAFRPRRRSETYLEYVYAVADSTQIPVEDMAPLVDTHHLFVYSTDTVDELAATQAKRALKAVRGRFWKTSGWWTRIRILFSPKPLAAAAFQRVALVRSSIRASSAARSV
ncbi:MAG: DUF3488 and transglutaminase-like domain-containing protein [Actinobacteria bacterium]|nr:DUF3488 and transglutaminase-like domain-containing protein [Actinomycetota bacterium]